MPAAAAVDARGRDAPASGSARSSSRRCGQDDDSPTGEGAESVFPENPPHGICLLGLGW